MTRHLLGGTWSPSVSTYALQQTAKVNTNSFPHDVTSAVLHNFYVDDFLKSLKAKEAICMTTELQELLAKGGFLLCNWLSNDKEVLAAVPRLKTAGISSRENAGSFIGCQFWRVYLQGQAHSTPIHKTWSTRDSLFRVRSYGFFVTPYSIRGKCLIHDLTRAGLGWDDPLPDIYLAKWQDWLGEIEAIHGIEVDRCLRPADFQGVFCRELLHFADASTAAYGSVSYKRQVNTEGNVRLSLLFSRSRVTLLKQITVPRLELAAAAALSVQQKRDAEEGTHSTHRYKLFLDR